MSLESGVLSFVFSQEQKFILLRKYGNKYLYNNFERLRKYHVKVKHGKHKYNLF